MKLNFNKAQCFTVPEELYELLNLELKQYEIQPPKNAITLNFRDPNYTSEAGGYHPVEIHLEQQNQRWNLIYITDFSYQGYPLAELSVDIDISFTRKQVFSVFDGWLTHENSKELAEIFINNFISYHNMNAYQTSINFN